MFQKEVEIVGIAGKIGSGKSAVGALLRERGYTVIDVDKVAHEILGLPFVQDKIRHIFGDKVFDHEGNVCRKTLGSIVFSDPVKLFTLNRLMFGLVYIRTVEKLLEFSHERIFIESALLFSVRLDHICDMILYVDASSDTRLGRIMEGRGLLRQQALKRLNSQDDFPATCNKKHFIIPNNCGKEELKRNILACLNL